MDIFPDWLESIPFPMIITNQQKVIKNYNSLFSRHFDKVVIGKNIKELFHQWETFEKQLILARLENQSYLLQYNYIECDTETLVLYIVSDGTSIQHLQGMINELEHENRELDAIFENSSDGIYITDSDGLTLKINAAVERAIGHPKETFIGKNIKQLLQDGVVDEAMTFKVLEQGKTIHSIPTNHFNTYLKTAVPIYSEDGEIKKVVTYLRDLSELNHLYQELKKALEISEQYKAELEKLKNKTSWNPNVVVESKQMLDIYEMGDRIANYDATVLILGETGVGKDILAQHIYHASQRQLKGEFIKINCGSIPNDLLESELFGFEAGSFTGASRSGKPGLFELADKGVLFLDEVGELPLALQVKLLRALQDKQIQRIGGTKPKSIDVRLIAATNRNLKEMVEKGEFREDLYYRLNVLPISIPPLRERREDILPLVQSILQKVTNTYGISKEFDQNIKNFFYNYNWPGNVRELSNLVERLVITVPSNFITTVDLPEEYQDKVPVAINEMTLKEAAENAEREILSVAVQKFKNTYELAEGLGSSQATIVRKLKKYNLTIIPT
ncbi:sigma-54 interaction domain-containing protein [Metabacillus rhizolycopersici]|uniref:HTH-type transcriptional regulatory protein TyrR n=1 Tax=Metabacillus rhizolycopersici TaxID=2875709 RepID=A0ABS7UYG8_9BACI|nr:sigma 54-interacting transcriptional regulator [Metabacillus rhizolycopersici]MBZ5752965.1 sigma 54-interacting transcriptional regulator [Metabacillus rhizolycopersici]